MNGRTTWKFVRSLRRTLPTIVIASLPFVTTPAQSGERPGSPPLSTPMSRRPSPPDSMASLDIQGVYASDQGPERIRVVRLFGDFHHLASTDGWEGVGILDGTIYRGVFHERGSSGKPTTKGDHVIVWSPSESTSIRTIFGSRGAVIQYWHRLQVPAATPDADSVSADIVDDMPLPDLRGIPDEMPVAVTRAACESPLEMLPSMEGTVIVLALVLEDGIVSDTRVVKSIPMLDEAAIECARQWRFRPAKTRGVPVAAWFAIPIRFTGR